MTPEDKAHIKADWERIKAMRLKDKISLLWLVPVLLLAIVVGLVLPSKDGDPSSTDDE